MFLIKESNFLIHFGDAKNYPVDHREPTFKGSCENVLKELGLKKLLLQHQVHGLDGTYIDTTDQLKSDITLFECDGDYAITSQPGVGIGVITADCLPIVFYDKANKVIGAAHAGWKGSVAGVAVKVINEMLKKHKFIPSDLRVFLGPCAKNCCYEVQKDFLKNLDPFSFKVRVVEQRDGKFYFDLPLFNKLLLIDLGIDPALINMDSNKCTICSPQYHSYRRNGNAKLCQATIVGLV